MRGESDSPEGGRLPFRSLSLPQREVALLIVLCVIAAVMFAATRRMAGWSRGKRAEAAAQWFARGEDLAQAGNLEDGIAALREAVAEERQNPNYVLGLARRLAEAGRNPEATQLLLRLRQDQPDDVEVNYGLARLAALNGDGADAIRYYNYAMYGLVRIGVDYDRRRIRTELIEFLLTEDEHAEALIELEALNRELPDEPDAQLQAARLSERAGGTRQAFDHYRRAATLAPKNAEAAAGVGNAAFALRDFTTASRELARAVDLGATAPDLAAQLEVARLVLVTDPLASRVASAARAARLRAGLAHAISRYDACQKETSPDQTGQAPALPQDPTRAGLEELRRGRQSELRDLDVLARGVTLIGTVEASVRSSCPALMAPIDRAWELIAEIHPGGGQ